MMLTGEQLAKIEQRHSLATTGPWLDLTVRFGEACARDHKVRGKWWHGSLRASTPLCLIAADSVHGRKVEDNDFPKCVDYWDLRKVIGIRWSDLKSTSFGGSLNRKDTVFITHSWQDIADLLEEVRRLKKCLADTEGAA